MSVIRDILTFFEIDDNAIRFFVYGGTGAVVYGVSEDKNKTYRRFVALCFVGAAMSSFITPAVIVYFQIVNMKYQIALGFLIGMVSMVLVGKIINYAKKISLKWSNIEVSAKEGEDDDTAV